MVTVTRDPERYRVLPGEGYDGVVQVSAEGFYGSGVLLNGGRAVLTSAHVIEGATSVTVNMDTPAGQINVPASQYALHPLFDSANGNGDLALVWLGASAPVTAERRSLYREDDEVGSNITLVGYGLPGDGLNGYVESGSVAPAKRLAENRFDTTGETMKDALGRGIGWDPLPGSQLIIDFDNGTRENDALGALMGLQDTGRGAAEGLIAPGDSGGPAFIDQKVAGVATYTASLGRKGQSPDVNDELDSSFGEIASFQRVSHYQQWIDQSLRVADPDAPTRPEEVETHVFEGDEGTTLAYFLLEFNGQRDDPEQWLSVDYATRDGTATAGEDYVAVADTLILYPDETRAAIPVEVIGDDTPEPDETFYLDVFNPVGGSFGEDVLMLTAVRTIQDDDGWIA
ncbi:Calx-beta domain-containing protein [Halomonas sp. CUBES01]|uniref:Calx-beta domain-containing protein n=1 Tax=Vreelandella gomseomensis TaxID=370766 RepID=A0ABU1GGF9_9GAMM|nr:MULTISPECIES: Calx-beta domain-containing protein [Halomonas]MDR5876564.1 Calx-beta domain-containing protein [Halomonas gomseomensis]MEC4766725.1 Calx-beta domain-containing protein [Halomonas sp. CUBES01]